MWTLQDDLNICERLLRVNKWEEARRSMLGAAGKVRWQEWDFLPVKDSVCVCVCVGGGSGYQGAWLGVGQKQGKYVGL